MSCDLDFELTSQGCIDPGLLSDPAAGQRVLGDQGMSRSLCYDLSTKQTRVVIVVPTPPLLRESGGGGRDRTGHHRNDKSGSDKSGNEQPQHLSDSAPVALDSGAEDGEEDGESTSEEDANADGPDCIKSEGGRPVGEETGPESELDLSSSDKRCSGGKDRVKQDAGEDADYPSRPATVACGVKLDVREAARGAHASKSGGACANRHSYTAAISPPPVSSSSKRLGLPGQDTQMTLVMPTMPPALLSKGKKTSSPLDSGMVRFPLVSSSATGQTDDQPLDLSTKPDRLTSPSFRDLSSKNSDSLLNSPGSSIHNGFSSLQSLQQRFGGDFPIELRQKSVTSVIPLQPSISHKSSLATGIQAAHGDSVARMSSSAKLKAPAHSDWIERQEMLNSKAISSSPLPKGESSRQTSPSLADDSGLELSSKHTIHRCSCLKTFNTLYALSFHLQETGHTPGPIKGASLMDYPKLVRGQDMWLNQESEQTRRILRCMQCGESFKSLPLLTVHMMQTQHYTKIVSSDHGRRSHKCSTYCDRELDKECIFKCKVCHDAFTDMEGLANHMIVSGHHKKQSSRSHPASNPTMFAEGASSLASLARQGKRKRFLPEDTNPSTVASLLEYRRKQSCGNGKINGFHSDFKSISNLCTSSAECKSPDSRAPKLVVCDSCGKRVDIQDFDIHIRACLRQRAEVIDALKNKLAAEEAILSRSESKLLRSGFSLSSVARYQGDSIFSRPGRDSPPAPIDHRLSEEKGHSLESAVKSEPSSPRDLSSTAETQQSLKMDESSANRCDLAEVPLKKWYGSNGDLSHPAVDDDDSSPDPHPPECSTLSFLSKDDKAKRDMKDIEADLRPAPSPQFGRKRKLSEVEDPVVEKDRESFTRPVSNLIIFDKSADFTSSALQQLDMFSRGLKFSPPRHNLSPENKTGHQAGKINKRKDLSNQGLGSRKEPSRSPAPVSSPASSSHFRNESPDHHKKEVTFDIIDPDTVEDRSDSKSSALEAMESFIHKSFSSKSDLRTSNLATMFSPFRNCFPLPPQGGTLPPTISDPTMSHFAKFSKFFRMVPGVSSFPEVPSVPDTTSRSLSNSSDMRLPLGQDKAASLGKKLSNKPYLLNTTTKSSPGAKISPESSTILQQDSYLPSKKCSDVVQSSKKYKYSSLNTMDFSHLSSKLNSLITGISTNISPFKNGPSEHYPLSKTVLEGDKQNEDVGKKRRHHANSEITCDPKKVYVKSENMSDSEEEILNIKKEKTSDNEEEFEKTDSLRNQSDSENLEISRNSPKVSQKEDQPCKSTTDPPIDQDKLIGCHGNNTASITVSSLSHTSEDIDSACPSPAPPDMDSSKGDTHSAVIDSIIKHQHSKDDAAENKPCDVDKPNSQSKKQFCDSNIWDRLKAGNDGDRKPNKEKGKSEQNTDNKTSASERSAASVDVLIKKEVDSFSDIEKSDSETKNMCEEWVQRSSDISSVKVETSDHCDSERRTDILTASKTALGEMSRPLSSCESGSAQPSPSSQESIRDVSPISNGHSDSKAKSVKTGKKKSALDSLSSFVYSQPLTSEHPLDSLQRLLSTNDLIHPAYDKHSATSSQKCLTPDVTSPLNLTTNVSGNGAVSGGCSSDDNDECDSALAEGGASEGEISEYKCAACNRRFASKGSYRYHLSRCHLSSVKKFGIKEAFNMSPYVYLPLDHTAKFSKYYQMAHELANKGK
ncbi:hypothetical protein Btru_017012 [Bulinus truncatus]|nr:hypothetical protein Btru_017012 [Bulinus truncatus]